MFKFFLKKKILTRTRTKNTGDHKERSSVRERRSMERYPVDHKHLTILSDQNILLVKDVSARGFATAISKQAAKNFAIDDVYEGRIRYLGEAFDVRARVTWKQALAMGFELVRPNRETTVFLSRLIEPIELASTLKMVDSGFMKFDNQDRLWYHGDNETDLYIWQTPAGELLAWQLCLGEDFIEWQMGEGLKSGYLNQASQDMVTPLAAMNQHSQHDPKVISNKRQMATDVIMASSVAHKSLILETLRTN